MIQVRAVGPKGTDPWEEPGGEVGDPRGTREESRWDDAVAGAELQLPALSSIDGAPRGRQGEAPQLCRDSSTTDTIHNRLDEIPLLSPHDQVKFVIKGGADYDFARGVVGQVRVPCPVVCQPVWGESDAKLLADSVLQDGLDVRVSLQNHNNILGEGPGH